MSAWNIVRMRVKPGQEEEFLRRERDAMEDLAGLRRGAIVRTGDRSYCFVAEWDSFDAIVAARPRMIASLDTIRDLLEDLGGGLGVTDPVSGETALEFGPR